MIKKLLLTAGLAGLVTGCAQSPLSPKGEAVFYALQADTMMNTWRYECAEVSSKANYVSQVARNEWWNRNGSLVEGADFGLAYNLVTVTDTRVDTGARVAMGLTFEVQERAQTLVREKLKKASDKEALCVEVLSDYRSGKWDLNGSEEIRGALERMKLESVAEWSEYNVRRGIVEKASGKRYGRSLYVVEKLAVQEDCDKASVSLLKGEWPYEFYDANCPDKAMSLVRCEWGRCAFVD